MLRETLALLAVAAALPAAARGPVAEDEAEKAPPPVTIGAREADRVESIIPGISGDGWAEGGKVDVQAPEPNQIAVTMTGTAAAHCRVGCQSGGLQTFRFVQEFEVSADPDVRGAVLSVESLLNGTLLARHWGSACLRVARARVVPVGRPGPTLTVAHPPSCVGGGGICRPEARVYRHEVEAFRGPVVPLGRYVLEAELVVEATAGGFLNGHAVADFSPETPLEGNWLLADDPFEEVDRKDFGFAVKVTAEPPPGVAAGPAAARRQMRVRPLQVDNGRRRTPASSASRVAGARASRRQ